MMFWLSPYASHHLWISCSKASNSLLSVSCSSNSARPSSFRSFCFFLHPLPLGFLPCFLVFFLTTFCLDFFRVTVSFYPRVLGPFSPPTDSLRIDRVFSLALDRSVESTSRTPRLFPNSATHSRTASSSSSHRLSRSLPASVRSLRSS